MNKVTMFDIERCWSLMIAVRKAPDSARYHSKCYLLELSL